MSTFERNNAARDAVRDDLSVERIGHGTTFIFVTNESALDEDSRMFGVSQHRKIRGFDTSVRGSYVLDEFLLDQFGELLGFGGAVECFNSQSCRAVAGVKVNAYKYCVAMPVRNGGTLGKGNEFILRSSHYRLESRLLEAALEPTCHIEIDVLFIHVGVRRSKVIAPVTRIDDDGLESGGSSRTGEKERCQGKQKQKMGSVRHE